jgi:AraC-like DNA-binding protein
MDPGYPQYLALIVAYLPDPQDRQAVVQGAGGGRYVFFCTDPQHVAAVSAQSPLQGIVIDWSRPGAINLPTWFQTLGTDPPVVVLLPLTIATARDLLVLSRSGLDVRVLIKGYEDLAAEVRALRAARPEPCADATILRRIGGLVNPPALKVVVGAVVSGKKRLRVHDLAQRCGHVVRTMERVLSGAALPKAGHLLGWSTALHGLWRLEVLEWPIKRAAAEAGFHSVGAFSNYVRRHTGARPTHLLEAIGFRSLLERFAGVLVNARVSTGAVYDCRLL